MKRIGESIDYTTEKYILKNNLLSECEETMLNIMVSYNKRQHNKRVKRACNANRENKLNDNIGAEELLDKMTDYYMIETQKLKRFKKNLMFFKRKIQNLRKRQQENEMNYTVFSRKQSVEPEPILSEIMKLPIELRRYIGSYLPYTVLNELVLSKYKIIPVMQNLNKYVYQQFLVKACQDKNISSVMTEEMFKQQLHRNPDYSPYWMKKYDLKYHRLKLIRIIYIAMETNPAYAYKILKMIYILLQPDRKYNLNYLEDFFMPL